MSQENTLNSIELTIVMPCLNEIVTLPTCIQSAQKALDLLKEKNIKGEIVVSDNGSTDGSQKMAHSLGCRVVNVTRRGYGNALIEGIKAAKGKYIVMGDADASYDFKEAVPMVLKLAEGYELCMGSRFKGKILPRAMPWKNHYIGNPALTGILNWFFRSGLSDAHCGLRAFTKVAFEKMRLSSQGMEFASEMVVKATLLNLKRAEVPVTLYPDGRDRPPHLQPWRDGWRHLKFLLMFSPLWLFFVPAGIMLFFSLFIFTVLLLTPPQEVFSINRFWVGNHWLILASGVFIIGYQTVIFGLISTAYHAQQQFIKVSPHLEKWVEQITVENAILLGSFLIIAGIAILFYIVMVWAGANYGPLAQIRPLVVATTLIVVGFQTLPAGFLLSMIGDETISGVPSDK